MIEFIGLGLVIISIYLFYKFLSKNDFNLNGLELILYEVSFILIFQIGSYYVEFYIRQVELGFILLMFLGIYYLLKTIKTHQYTKIWIILIYIILFFINGYTIGKIPTEGWEGLGLAILYIIFTIGVGIYILLMNFISYIIKVVKKKKGNIVENIKPKIKPLYKSIYKVLILIVIIFISISYIEFDKYLYNRIEEPYKERVSHYLKNKYTNLDFKIHTNSYENNAKCRYGKCYIPYMGFYVSTTLLEDDFYVYIDENDDIKDNFIEDYYYEITNHNPNKYFSNLLTNNFKNNNFNVNVKINVKLLDENTSNINTILKEEELLQLVQITDLKVIINDNFKDSESFEKYVKDLYKYYESYIGQYNQYKSLEYIFSNSNSNNNLIFKNGGSINKLGDEITVYYTDINR